MNFLGIDKKYSKATNQGVGRAPVHRIEMSLIVIATLTTTTKIIIQATL
jgi:hypothetical protein